MLEIKEEDLTCPTILSVQSFEIGEAQIDMDNYAAARHSSITLNKEQIQSLIDYLQGILIS